jgi:hypothetical protein
MQCHAYKDVKAVYEAQSTKDVPFRPSGCVWVLGEVSAL